MSTVLAVPEADLVDLRERLRRTRWAAEWPGAGWSAGTDVGELRRLVGYWRDGFDWRAREAEINALPSRTAVVGGTPVHFLRYDGERPDALPIVVTHGWPSSFLELTALAERLSAPSRFGGRAEDAFTVVVPSLPGFGLSPQRPSLPPDAPTHELWHRLMSEVLGFGRYAAHGGDLGTGVTALLAQAHPESVAGIHVLSVPEPPDVDPAGLSAGERAYRESVAAWFDAEGGYQHQQQTRPVTLGYALADSPVGLLAWLVEKYRAWSDCGGVLSRRFTDDFVLTQVSLYWFTNTISSSFRPYFEFKAGMRERFRGVSVPAAVAVFPKDLVRPPREWAVRAFAGLERFTEMPRGGHFAAHEEPGLLAADITEFFRPLR